MRDLHELTPSQVLRERFELEAAFASTPSASGPQLEAAHTRILGHGHNGSRGDGMEERRIRFMDLLVLTRGLKREDVEVCRLKYRTLAKLVPYDKLRRLSDVRTGDGETITATQVQDENGEPLPGWAMVRGISTRPASRAAVVEHLRSEGKKASNYTVDQALASAHASIAQRIKKMGAE
jgi:hypothetical protein